MSYNSKYTGEQVEALLDIISEGGEKTTEAEILAMGFTKNEGTITGVKMNGVSKGTSGVVDLGAVVTDVSGKQDKITDLDAIRSGAALGATALQSVPSEYVTESELSAKGYATTSALNDKVDKVSGKGLSTEDFTTALKTKLEGLNNYDDSEIEDAVSSLQTQLNTLVSGNANDAINSFNEIIAFLDGVKDTQDLASIIASIEQQIASKMDKVTLAAVATSGSYNDLSNKPTIPSAVTESTVSGWGFTKNTGTYSKPSGGIPKTDLASAVQTSLGKADSAVQPDAISEFLTAEDIPNADSVRTWGFVKGVKLNGSTKTPSVSDGIVDLGTIGGGGSSEGGSGMEYIEIEPLLEPGGAQLTLTSAEPNKVYIVTEELFYLEIQSFVEPNGLEGEYRFHFKALNCMIVLPDSVLWANGQMPDMIDGICELSIIGTRYQGEVVYKAILTAFA